MGMPIVSLAPGSAIHVGCGVTLISKSKRTALGVSHPVMLRTLRPGARITIGDHSGLSGSAICAASAISIGRRSLIGADVIIADTDFHPVDTIPRRSSPIPEPSESDRIFIGDDVFVGARCLILKGSRIGSGSVIGAGSTVTGEIPPGVVAAGIPARPIRIIRTGDSTSGP